MPTERWLRVLETFAAKAENGDRYALRFFADYMLGKPIERIVAKVQESDDLSHFFNELVDADDDTDDGETTKPTGTGTDA